MIKQRYAVLYGEFENEKKKDKKKLTPDFLIVPAHDLNFHGR